VKPKVNAADEQTANGTAAHLHKERRLYTPTSLEKLLPLIYICDPFSAHFEISPECA